MKLSDLKAAETIEDIDFNLLDVVHYAKLCQKVKPYQFIKSGELFLSEESPAEICAAWDEMWRCTRAQADYERLTGEFLY